MLAINFYGEMIKFILVFALTQDMDGENGTKESFEFSIQIQIRGSKYFKVVGWKKF